MSLSHNHSMQEHTVYSDKYRYKHSGILIYKQVTGVALTVLIYSTEVRRTCGLLYKSRILPLVYTALKNIH